MGCKYKVGQGLSSAEPTVSAGARYTSGVKPVPLLAATALVLAVVGCKAKDPLVGKWNGSTMGISTDYEFNEDGTMTSTAKVGPVSVTTKGTYKVEGEKFTMTLSSVGSSGAPADISAKINASTKDSINKPMTGTIKFPSEDKAEITAGPIKLSLTKVKSE